MANEVSNILKITFPIDMTDHVAEIIGKIQQEKNLHCVYDDFENTRDWYERRIGGKWGIVYRNQALPGCASQVSACQQAKVVSVEHTDTAYHLWADECLQTLSQ